MKILVVDDEREIRQVLRLLLSNAGYEVTVEVPPLGRENPWEGGSGNSSNILAWETHRQRSLLGNSPWGHKRVRHS